MAPGIAVTVLVDGVPTCDATVVALGEGRIETLSVDELKPLWRDECLYLGLWNTKGGHFWLAASLPGYANAFAEVDVRFGVCLPIASQVTFELTPLANPSDGEIEDGGVNDADASDGSS